MTGAADVRWVAGAGVRAAARSAVAGTAATAAAARGLARPWRGDHAPFWLAPLRVPSALAAREAGFGAQPGAGGANHRRPSRRGRRVGRRGAPGPAQRLAPGAPGIPCSRAPGPRLNASGCVHGWSAAPTPCKDSRLARLRGRAVDSRRVARLLGHGLWVPRARASRIQTEGSFPAALNT